MIKYSVIVGVGGTGAKIVEAVIQFAASGNAPQNIYPVLVDQDTYNANVKRCKNAIEQYCNIKQKIESSQNNDLLFRSKIHNKNNLLPIAPVSLNSNFCAAIGYERMKESEKNVIDALFNHNQLFDKLDYGYKKRAHMGAVMINRMLMDEELRDAREDGLKSLINEVKGFGENDCQIIICGSLFGGTGASGIVRIGEYFSKKLPNFVIKGIMMLPYFRVSKKFKSDDQDAGLVQSDDDMQAVKIALEMYKDQINQAFDHVFLVGTDNPTDLVSNEAVSGGSEQENPAHVFEALAAVTSVLDCKKSQRNTAVFHRYIYDTPQRPQVYSFDFNKLARSKSAQTDTLKENLVLNTKTLRLMRDFSNLMVITKDNDINWKKRQPWQLDIEKWDCSQKVESDSDKLLGWAIRHNNWWSEMSQKQLNGRKWEKFYFHDEMTISTYDLSGLLSIYLDKNQCKILSELIVSLNRIAKNKY